MRASLKKYARNHQHFAKHGGRHPVTLKVTNTCWRVTAAAKVDQ